MTSESVNQNQQLVESWNPQEKLLTSERKELLSDGLTEITAEINSGDIKFEPLDKDERPCVIMRLVTGANDEVSAKNYSNEQHKFDCKKSDKSVSVEDLSEGGFGGNVIVRGNGSVVIGGNISVGRNVVISGGGGSMSIVNGEVYMNGKRVTQEAVSGNQANVVKREIVFRVNQETQRVYELSSQSGNIELPKGKGEARLRTVSGDIKIGDFNGEVDFQSSSGDVTAKRLKGELGGSLSSGDLTVGTMSGNINVSASSGEITIRDLVAEGRRNSIKSSSGGIDVNTSNKSLRVRASTMSGEIEIDENKFKVLKRGGSKNSRGNGVTVMNIGGGTIVVGGGGSGDTIEAFCGEDSSMNQAPEIELRASSGDITVNHTGREIVEEVVKPLVPENTINFAECSYCRSAYQSDHVRVSNGVITEVINSECPCCGGNEPQLGTPNNNMRGNDY